MQLLQYLIKLSISIGIIWIFYTVVLRRLTFYNWNRWYLLGYSLLAFYIPFIDLSQLFQLTELNNNQVVQFIPVVDSYTAVLTTGKTAAPVSTFTYTDFVLLLAAAGSFILLVRLLVQYISFRRVKAKATLMTSSPVKVYHVDKHIIPFSFGSSIFINLRQHEEKELEEIIKHEFIHVRQKHTIDILWSELLCLLNWYNPFAWLIRKAIRQNLEFIADNKVLEGGINRKHYQYLLLKVMGAPEFSIAHQFNFSSLKKRIIMMNKNKSARLQLIRFLFLFPLATVLLLAFRSISQPQPEPAPAPVITEIIPTPVNPAPVPAPLPPVKGKPVDTVPVPKQPPPAQQPVQVVAVRAGFPSAYAKEHVNLHNAVDISYRNHTDTTKPLYIIDGIPQPRDGNPFANLSATNVSQIKILKGKGAIDIYGDDAKDGVILITTYTKSGGQPPAAANEADSVLKSLSISKALIVIDDVEYTYDEFTKLNLSPDSIRTIFIYKDSKATMLYGKKGANGVIKILTKKYKHSGVQNPKPYHFTAEQMKPIFEKAQREHILYIGIDNPMQFSFAGVGREDLLIDAGDMAEAIAGQNGVYNVRTRKPGQVKLEFFKKEKNGNRTLLDTQYYSSTFLPAPDKLLPMMVN